MHRTRRHRAAFSIIELLISLIIISILVAMVILIASQRANEARLRSAQADLRLIAEAEQQAVTDTGYFLRLYVLDDVIAGPDDPPAIPNSTNDATDALIEEYSNTRNPDGDTFGINPDYGSLASSSPTGTTVGRLVRINQLDTTETPVGVGLPYISYQRIYEDLNFADDLHSYGVPMDPWGMPYVVITRQGFINDVDVLFSGASSGFSAAQLQSVDVIGSGISGLNALIFDRFTILSFGPNALPGDGSGVAASLTDPGNFGKDDDLMVQLN